MNEQQQSRRVSTSLLVGVAALVLVAGGGVAWWAKNQPQTTLPNTTHSAIETITPPPPPPVAVEPAQPAQPAQSATTNPPATAKPIPVTTSAQVFWLTSTSTTTELVPVPVASTTKADKPEAALTEAFTTLLAGPSSPNTSSAIPQNTQLRNLTLKDDGVYIDLSKEFTSGGGSASMIARLAQVLYTATSIDANTKVWLSVDGQPLEVLGGEGLEVPQPLTRDLFKKEFAL